MARDVFISHANDDASVAGEVCALLEKRGLRCWMAPRDVDAGAVWDEAILDAIEQSRAFLLILSKSANESHFVKNEVNRAFSQRKPIVTFRLEEVVPGRSLELYLARHHWTDAFPPPLGARVESLASSITAMLDGAAAPAPTAQPVARPTLGARLLSPFRALAERCRRFGREAFVFGLIALLLGAAIASLANWYLKPSQQEALRPLVRLDVDLGPDVSLGSQAGADEILSPDGTRIVYVSQGRLFTRRLDQPSATELAGTQGAWAPFFSPDGQWVAFFTTGKLQKISVEGGSAITLCDATYGFGGSWGEDGNIIAALSGNGGLSRIPSAGGSPTPVTDLQSGEATNRWPQILPGGKAVLFTASPSAAFDAAGGKWQISNSGGTYPMWSRTEHELFFETLDNHIMVAAYSVKGDFFEADKPRAWSEKQLGGTVNSLKNVDLAPDGKRIVALMPVETAEAQKAQNQVKFLENFFDEVRRRTATQAK